MLTHGTLHESLDIYKLNATIHILMYFWIRSYAAMLYKKQVKWDVLTQLISHIKLDNNCFNQSEMKCVFLGTIRDQFPLWLLNESLLSLYN